MRRPFQTPAAALMLLGVALPGGAMGEDIAASALRQGALAAQVYALGLEQGDPLMALAAARLAKASGTTEGWQAMLAAAEALSGQDATLLALAADIRAEGTKGVASGPVHTISQLAPGAAADPLPMTFRGGEYAEVYVEGPLGFDLNLTVLDAAGNVVCADTDKSHVAYCTWTPAADGAFTVTVQNLGAVPAEFVLMTN